MHSSQTAQKIDDFHPLHSNTNINSTIRQHFEFMKLSVLVCLQNKVKDLSFEVLKNNFLPLELISVKYFIKSF